MRLPWRREKRKQVPESTLSRQRAEADLERTREETAYYAALGERLKELREVNHLTELFFTNRHQTRGQE